MKTFVVIIRSRQHGILDIYETDSIRNFVYCARHIERLCARYYAFVTDFTFTLTTDSNWKNSFHKETNHNE